MAQPVNVALCFDRHLALPAATVVVSVMRRCSQPVHFYLIIDPAAGLKRFLYAVLAHFDASGTVVEATPESVLGAGHNVYSVPSTATYRRFYLARLVPDVDRLIYLDSDVVVRHDLTELWRQPLEGHPLAAVPHGWAADNETMLEHFPNGYFNDGVLLLDLACWRAQGITSRLEDSVRASLASPGGVLWHHDEGPLNEISG